jgi:predicted MFS family arabinose efflux permease
LPEAAATSWRRATLTGFRHLFREQNGRLGAITVTTAALTAFSGAYWTITVVLADRNWHLGSQALGFINAAYGTGAILGTFLVARLARRFSPIIGYVVSLAGSAGAIALFGLSAPGAFPFIALGTFALIEMQNQVLGNTLIQTSTAPELLGRVFGAFEAVVVSAVVLGAVVAGPLIDLLGARTTTIVFAVAPVIALIVSLPKLLTTSSSVAVQPTLA